MPGNDLLKLHRLTLEAPGEALFAALAAHVPGLSRHQARRAVVAGLASLAGTPVLEPKHPLPERAVVELDLRHGIDRAYNARLYEGSAAPGGQPFTILYQDSRLVVVDKAVGIMSSPPPRTLGQPPVRGHLGELVRRALRRRGEETRFLGLVHRLDRDTSGCLVLAFDREAHRILGEQFATHSAARTYRALVAGQPRRDQDRLVGRIGRREAGKRAMVEEDEPGVEAVTTFRVLRRLRLGAELEVSLETGRTHQIRVALAGIGCPVLGDRVYAHRPRKGEAPPPRAPRLMLHAERLAFDHPSDGHRLEVAAPLPAEFDAMARLLA